MSAKVNRKRIVQVSLRSGNSLMTTWLEKRVAIIEGMVITLKEIPGKRWTVVTVYDKELEATDLDFHRKWDNNNYDKHKGLDL